MENIKIYVVNMGRQTAENYHVGFVTIDFQKAIKFISENLIYGEDHQWCNHIYNRVHDMQCWEDGELLYEYGSLNNDRINQIKDDEALSPEEIEEDIKRHITKVIKI